MTSLLFFSLSEWKPFSVFIRVRVRAAYLSSVIEIKIMSLEAKYR